MKDFLGGMDGGGRGSNLEGMSEGVGCETRVKVTFWREHST